MGWLPAAHDAADLALLPRALNDRGAKPSQDGTTDPATGEAERDDLWAPHAR